MMKKNFIVAYFTTFFLGLFGLVLASSHNFSDVLDWLHSNNLTKYSQVEDFRPFDNISRWEAAKFLAEFAELQGLEKTYNSCTFSDIDTYDYTLVPYIKEVCAYGLMKWSEWRFRPEGNITEAEALTTVIRSVYWFFEETAHPWWIAYYNRWVDLGLITDESLLWIWDVNISREKLWTWIYQTAQLQENGWFYSFNSGEAHYKRYSESAFDNALSWWYQVALFFHSKSCPICHWIRDFITDGIQDLPSDVRIFEVSFEDSSQSMKEKYWVTSQFTFVFFDKDWNAVETSNKVHLEEADFIDALLKRFK